MTAPTCALTLNVADLAGANVSGATVTATLSHPDAYQGMVVAGNASGTTDSSGNVTLTLFRSALGELGSYYTISAAKDGQALGSLHVRLPNLSAATLALCEVARRPFRYSSGSTVDVVGRVLSVGGVLPDAGGDVPLEAIPVDAPSVFDLVDAAPTLTGGQLGMRRVSADSVQFLFKDAASGALRKFNLPLMGETDASLVIDVSQAPYYMSSDTPDNTALINIVLSDASTLANAVGPVATYWPGLYKTQGGHVASGRVSMLSPNITKFGLNRIAGGVEALLSLMPVQGGSSGARIRQYIELMLDSKVLEVSKSTGTIDPAVSLDVISGMPASEIAAWNVGDKIEGVGIRPGTRILAKPTSTSIQVSRNFTQANTGKTKIVRRETVTVTATSAIDSKVLAVANTAGIRVGMKIEDDGPHHVPVDPDDGYQYAIVKSIVPNVSVTMDRDAVADGAFTCTFYSEPDGLRLIDADQAVGYTSTKEYEGVTIRSRITGPAGDGISIRRGRDQVHVITGNKVDSCYGHNIIATESKDSFFHRSTFGTPWKTCITQSGSGIRASGEWYDPYQTDKFPAVQVIANKGTFIDADINGMVDLTKANAGGVSIMKLIGCNHMLHPSDVNPGGTTPAYIIGRNGIVVHAIGSTFMLTDGGTIKPDYLFQSFDDSHMVWLGGDLITDVLDPDCPFGVALCNDMSKFHGAWLDVTTQRYGEMEATFAPTLTALSPGDLGVSYSAQEGWVKVSNGMATARVVVAFTPTYTTASGGLRVEGLPTWSRPSDAASNPQISVAVDSSGCDWGAGYTQLFGRVKSTGSLSIDKAGDNLATAPMLLSSCPSGVAQRFEFFGSWKV